jgi:hypothetical protein
MAITIDGKEYDETTLDNNVKNSILQVQNSNQSIARLQAEILNHQILAQHHSKFIKDNLPTDDEGTKEEVTTNPAVAAAEEEIK